ncbi:nuclear transport factor 2 family protein [Phreatobacter stygius]|uniref:Nuclear transport factor 2 family protein n=1 Tax=Phreatobacter stygius TaxID=1940610 RepID=A0A4D7B4S7_9HYPH|nr:nuclear transport factor 2 family protein [Phreatobacter stygius]QCI63212.1 nuclear transport factor 2 family protein [Phreatobacter stygius]
MSGAQDYAIETVIRRFALLNDAGRWEELADLFTDDAVFARPSAPDRPLGGRPEILAAFRARPARRARHLVCNTVVTMTGPDTAEAFSYSVLIGVEAEGRGSLSVGHFDDRLVCRDGAWKFASRRGATVIDRLDLGAGRAVSS